MRLVRLPLHEPFETSFGAIYRRNAERDLPYRVPGYPWTPLLFIGAAGALVVSMLATQPYRAAVGFGIVLLGTPAFFLWQRRGKKVQR